MSFVVDVIVLSVIFYVFAEIWYVKKGRNMFGFGYKKPDFLEFLLENIFIMFLSGVCGGAVASVGDLIKDYWKAFTYVLIVLFVIGFWISIKYFIYKKFVKGKKQKRKK